MDKISKIKAEIERLKEKSKSVEMDTEYTLAWLLDFIDSFPEEPVSEDLEEEIIRYIGFPQEADEDVSTTMIRKAAHHFANWQEEQFERNRLAACDAQTRKEADREWDFVEKMINEEHRQPTYSDAIEYGMRGMKQQMMKYAIDAVMHPDDGEIWVDKKDLEIYYEGMKVKVIIMKET